MAKDGCHRCSLKGTYDYAVGKIIWAGNYKWLDNGSKIRSWFTGNDSKFEGNLPQ